MDVHCTTCGEPWDVYHLWHEAIFETGLSHEEARAWHSLPRSQKLTSRYRKEFRAAGWQFGQTFINVIRCPACPKDARPNPDRLQTKAALEELLGDDEDGLAATFEDLREENGRWQKGKMVRAWQSRLESVSDSEITRSAQWSR